MIIIGSSAPSNMPIGTIVHIKKDMGLSQTADILEKQHIIRSVFLYKVYSILLGGYRNIKAGDYLFSQQQSAIKVASRIISGSQELPKIKITIPEGKNVHEIAWLLLKIIPDFNAPAFVALAQPLEGYLFPETYFFYPNVQADEVVTTMRREFGKKMETIQNELIHFGFTLQDIITMASIVEKEATSTIDRKIIAGVLWNRFQNKAALQVDPPFFYILGKDSSELTLDDLAIDSPYNLYKHIGLPPTPIDSPSLDAILATIRPTKTNYWFYLSGYDGLMHYAVTYDGHLANKAKYIK